MDETAERNSSIAGSLNKLFDVAAPVQL